MSPHPSPPAKNLPCVQTHLAQLPAPSSHPSWGDPPLQRFQGWGEKRERAGQIRWEQQRERDGADDKREGRGSQADRAKPETRGAESEAQAEHQSLRETERWMELGVPPGRGSGGGGGGGPGIRARGAEAPAVGAGIRGIGSATVVHEKSHPVPA